MTEPARLLICSALLLPITLFAACKHETRTPEAEAPTPYALPGLDHGLLQSPVNILTSEAEGDQHKVALNLHNAEPSYLENKGHTIQLDFPSGSSITFDGRDYKLEQLHFHTPSEHQIDGITYPMEMHIVNMMEPTSEGGPPCYLVVSFLYKMGAEDPFITGFLAKVPAEEGREELEHGQVHIPAEDGDTDYEYYHYRGSLTTPPYTETVEWLIVKAIQEASPEQIRRINLLEGNNARRVQALYGRKVE